MIVGPDHKGAKRDRFDRLNNRLWWAGYMACPISRNGTKFAVIAKPDLKAMQADRVDAHKAVLGAQRLFVGSLDDVETWLENAITEQEDAP
jgi:hypothetical protein